MWDGVGDLSCGPLDRSAPTNSPDDDRARRHPQAGPWRVFPDKAVDRLADEVGVPDMPGVLRPLPMN